MSYTKVDLGTEDNLFAIWGSGPNDIFVVGTRVLHYDGARWSDVGVEVEEDTRFSAVWGRSPSEVYVASTGGHVLRYDGVSWSPLETGFSGAIYELHGTTNTRLRLVGQGGAILSLGPL
ncbi:MAG: hypothetical protein JRH20_29315 [Deltaproteobacteria bacterium]|nr:hypothetical protein [Deltaproteobacteria bacterium]